MRGAAGLQPAEARWTCPGLVSPWPGPGVRCGQPEPAGRAEAWPWRFSWSLPAAPACLRGRPVQEWPQDHPVTSDRMQVTECRVL